jgi:hypothetical protein
MAQAKRAKTEKYIVESMCEETWEVFTDVVFAVDCEQAEQRIEKLRPYATGFNAMSMESFERFAERIRNTTRKQAAADLKELKDSLG